MVYRVMAENGQFIGAPIRTIGEARKQADLNREASIRVETRMRREGRQFTARHFTVVRIEEVYTTSADDGKHYARLPANGEI